MIAPTIQTKIEYPDSDGKPMGETDIHISQLIDLIFTLRAFFRADPTTYVAGNMLMYFVEGDSSEVVAPDVLVVKGVKKYPRRSYRVWEEGKAPDVVFEITSKSTRREDLHTKRLLYEELGVQEYFLFDPLGEYLNPSLQGFRRVGQNFESLTGASLWSQVMGLELRAESGRLRLFDPSRNKYLLSPEETESEIERLQAELEKLRGNK